MANLLSRFRWNRQPPAVESSVAESSSPADKDKSGNATIKPEEPDVDSKSTPPLNLDHIEEDDLPQDIADLPKIVRNTVSLEDDPSAPCVTFRYFLLCFIFIPPGAILFQMGQYRTTSAAYPILFVQIASYYVGHWLARTLPAWTIRVPLTSFSFSLNPGPFHIKENVLVAVTASSGATSNAAWAPISLAKLYYDTDIPAATAIFFMWAIVFIGYAMAAVARQFLVYDPVYLWPYSLMQTAVFENLRKSATDSVVARKQKIVFFGVFLFAVGWHFLPEYVFPMTSSLAFLCWVAPRNSVANFIGSGIGGMGFLNLSLDWGTISTLSLTNPMIAPFWTTVVLTVAFIFNSWILIPAAKWGDLASFKPGLMSNRLFLANGTRYPIAELVTKDMKFNETAYEENGPIFAGAQYLWSLFFDYSSYVSAVVWMSLFGYPKIRDTVRILRERSKKRGHASANDFYMDRLNVLMRAYKEVPLWWYVALFVASFVTIITILANGYFFIPVWTFFIALLTSGIMIIPFSWLYAISAFQVAIGSFNELLYGYMIHTGSGHRHIAGATTYGAIAGDVWYRAQYMLQDQKIGHYMHVAPRAIFFSQIFGELIGVPINYAIIQWVLKEKRDYLLGNKKDPIGQWTGQSLSSYNTMGTMYVAVGPKRLFSQSTWSPLPYGFLYGALAPFVIFGLYKLFPKSKLHFNLWNVTVFGAGMSQFYGNLSTGMISRLIVGYISMYYFYRRRFRTWSRYNYNIAAALDAGFNISILLIFCVASAGRYAPHWWGNNEKSVERCFALDD